MAMREQTIRRSFHSASALFGEQRSKGKYEGLTFGAEHPLSATSLIRCQTGSRALSGKSSDPISELYRNWRNPIFLKFWRPSRETRRCDGAVSNSRVYGWQKSRSEVLALAGE